MTICHRRTERHRHRNSYPPDFDGDEELDVVVATPALHDVAERAGSLAVRSRVSEVAELQAFYELPAATP